jgi:hypothetical protein
LEHDWYESAYGGFEYCERTYDCRKAYLDEWERRRAAYLRAVQDEAEAAAEARDFGDYTNALLEIHARRAGQEVVRREVT